MSQQKGAPQLQQRPDDIHTHYNRGLTLLKLGDPEGRATAIEDFELAVRRSAEPDLVHKAREHLRELGVTRTTSDR